MKIVTVVAAIVLLALTASCSSTVYTHGVPNLVQVAPGVWRSGQPTSAGAWAYLQSIGIKRVVKLNFDDEGSDVGATKIGMEVIPLPIEPNGDVLTVFQKPDGKRLSSAVAVLGEGNAESAVLVHCTHGQDRTGLVVAIYRIQHDGWRKSAARREMIARGFHSELPGLEEYWEDDVKVPAH